MDQTPKTHLAVLASGSSKNAANLIDYFERHRAMEVSLTVSNNPGSRQNVIETTNF